MSRKNYYYQYYERCCSGDPEIVEMSREHWDRIHKENLEAGRTDLLTHSGTKLDMIALAQGKLVQNVPKWVRDRTAWYMTKYWMDLHDAFHEAVRDYKHPSKELQQAFMEENYRKYIPSAYVKLD